MNIAAEHAKHRTAPIVTGLATLAIISLLYLEPVLSTSVDTLPLRRALVSVPNSPNYVLSGLAALLPFGAIAMGAALMGAEFRWGTARHQAVLRTTRSWLLDKVAFASLLPPLAVGFGLGAGVVTATLAEGFLGTPTPGVVTFDPEATARQVLTTLVGLELWLVVSMGVTLALRSAAGGALATLAYVYVESIAAPLLLPDIARFLPATAQIATLQVFRYLPDVGVVGSPLILPGLSWGAALGVVAVTWVLAAVFILAYGSQRDQPV